MTKLFAAFDRAIKAFKRAHGYDFYGKGEHPAIERQKWLHGWQAGYKAGKRARRATEVRNEGPTK